MTSRPFHCHACSSHFKNPQGAEKIKLKCINTNIRCFAAWKFDAELDHAVRFVKLDDFYITFFFLPSPAKTSYKYNQAENIKQYLISHQLRSVHLIQINLVSPNTMYSIVRLGLRWPEDLD